MIIKRMQAWLMLWLGRKLFAFVKTWAPKENQAPTVMHFAHSERDFNTAIRQHVEELDECPHQYAEVLTGVKCIKCGHFVGNWE